MADEFAAVTTAFGHVAVYRCPPTDSKVVIATAGGMPTDDERRARIGALDARFGGALSFAGRSACSCEIVCTSASSTSRSLASAISAVTSIR